MSVIVVSVAVVLVAVAVTVAVAIAPLPTPILTLSVVILPVTEVALVTSREEVTCKKLSSVNVSHFLNDYL